MIRIGLLVLALGHLDADRFDMAKPRVSRGRTSSFYGDEIQVPKSAGIEGGIEGRK